MWRFFPCVTTDIIALHFALIHFDCLLPLQRKFEALQTDFEDFKVSLWFLTNYILSVSVQGLSLNDFMHQCKQYSSFFFPFIV